MQRLLLLLPVALCSVGCMAWRKNTITPQELPPELHATALPTLKPLHLAQLGKPVQAEYRLAPGDVVEVVIPGLIGDDHTQPLDVRVQENGTVTLPLLGPPMPLAGLTVAEAEQRIAAACRDQGLLRQPEVLVSLRQTRKIRVNLLGAVAKPGEYELNGNDDDLLAALVAAGGLTDEAGTVIEVHRRVLPEVQSLPGLEPAPALSRVSAEVPAAAGQAASPSGPAVLLPTLATAGRPDDAVPARGAGSGKDLVPAQANVLRFDLADDGGRRALSRGVALDNGDTVSVEARKLKPIYVIGMVNKPGEYKLPVGYDLRLLDAIGLAGGVDRSTLPNKAVLIRQRPGHDETVAVRVDLDDAKKDQTQNLRLMPGDTVSVEETPQSFCRGLLREAFHIGLGATMAPAIP